MEGERETGGVGGGSQNGSITNLLQGNGDKFEGFISSGYLSQI